MILWWQRHEWEMELLSSTWAEMATRNHCWSNPVNFFKKTDQLYFHALTLVHLGNAELGLGHLEKARTYHEEALAEARLIGENWLISFALNNLGEVARTQGQFDLARKYYVECEALLHPTGDRGDVARFIHNLGYIAQHEEEFELAEIPI